MAKSVLPIQLGYDYQSQLFWSKACDLFLPHTKTIRVEFEVDDVKSFDDVVVIYSTPIPDCGGFQKSRDYYQAKFHSHNTHPIEHSSLIDPAYIGATTTSFLQKLLAANRKAADLGDRYGYVLFSPSAIHPDDVLSPIWNRFNGRLDVEKLFEGKTEKSEMWRARNQWLKHLGVSEEELRSLISMLIIRQGPDSTAFREQLSKDLLLAGLRPIDNDRIANTYNELIQKLHCLDMISFDRQAIEEIAKKENLWIGNSVGYPKDKTIGIRSFMKYAEEMPNLTSDMICLTDQFNGRHLKDNAGWTDGILKPVAAFIEKHQSSGETAYILLETHLSIAFAAGASIDPKSSTKFVPIQKNEFKQPEVWSISGDCVNGDNWKLEEISRQGEDDDLVVEFSITHSATIDVTNFADRSLGCGRAISFEILPKPGNNSVRDGNHAYTLASEAAQFLVRHVKENRVRTVHIFAAAPNAFMFYLGKLLRLPASCEVNLYEYDFDSKELGAYKKSITICRNQQEA